MRRTIISTVCMAVVLVLAASCSKQEDDPVVPKGTVITAVADQIGTGTKVEMAYCYNALWQTGDQIHVKQGQTTDTFTLVDGKGTTKGTFEGTKSISGEIEAFYPVSVGESMEWPSVQPNKQVAPMYARQSITGTGNETVNFSSLGAMLQIAFSTKTEGATITSITLKDDSKPLSGKFTVDGSKAIMAENASTPGVTLNLGESGVPVGVAATYFYLAIPAGEYNGDKLTLTFYDAVHGTRCVMTSTTFPNIARNTVGRITLAGEFSDLVTVKLDLNFEGKTGDKTPSLEDMKVKSGQILPAPATPYARNYVFRGWYKESTCENPWDFETRVNGDMTLYAKWVEIDNPTSIHGHECVRLACLFWATENIEGGSACERGEDSGDGDYYPYPDDAIVAITQWNTGSDNHDWALPTVAQWEGLRNNCDCKWVEGYSHKGRSLNGLLISGRADHFEDGNSIFLPASGCYYYPEDEQEGKEGIMNKGIACFYWAGNVYVYALNTTNKLAVGPYYQFESRKIFPTARAVAQ